MPSSTVAAYNTLHQQLITVLANQENIMLAIDDLKAAEANVSTAIQSAITLIMQLRSNPAGTSDADVEAVVAQLNQAATDLGMAVTPPPAP